MLELLELSTCRAVVEFETAWKATGLLTMPRSWIAPISYGCSVVPEVNWTESMYRMPLVVELLIVIVVKVLAALALQE
jgi:uncharacterized membrane protein YfhO